MCKNTFLIVRASAHCSWAWQFPDYLPRSAPVTLQSAYEALWHLFGAVKAGLLRRHRLQQAFGADDFHHSLQVIGEHIQAHFSAHPVQFSSQEVRCSHPLLERPEGMLNSPLSNPHHLRCLVQPALHFLQHSFMFPAPYSTICAWRALGFQRATLAL